MLLHLVLTHARGQGHHRKVVVPLTSGFTIHSVAAWEDEKGQVELLTSAWACEDVAKGNAKGGLLGNGRAVH